MNKRNTAFFTSGKRNPVNLYYNLQPFLTSHNNSRNFSGRTNTDTNISNNLVKSKKWNLSEMIDIKKKLNLAVKKRMAFVKNKQMKKMSTLSHIHMNSINDGIINNKFSLNSTNGNTKVLSSYNNTKKKSSTNNSHNNYTNKAKMVKKKINFSNMSNNSFKSYKQNPIKKKIIKNKVKNGIPFNINKININIINNNNININTIKTEGNISKNPIKKLLKRKKNFTLDKLPQFDELLKKNNTKEKDKLIRKKLFINRNSNLSKKRNNNINTNISSTNYSLSNRLNNVISNHDDISLLSKNFIKNIKKNIINFKNKKLFIVNDKSLEHKKIVPINYFQDYKKKNSSVSKNIKKQFINYNGNIIKFRNNKKIKKNKNNILISKQKRPYSKEDKVINIMMKGREKSKEAAKNKMLKLIAKKSSLPDYVLLKKINKPKNQNTINALSKSEIKNRRAKSNNKTQIDESQKIFIKEEDNMKEDTENNHECDITDIVQNRNLSETEPDNFDDLYSIVRKVNFDEGLIKDDIFNIDENDNYFKFKKKFEKIWNKPKFKSYKKV